MIKICPVCGEPAELNGRQKQCARCSNAIQWKRYNEKYNGISLEESQKEILTTHAGVKVLNNAIGQVMVFGDFTVKERYLNAKERKECLKRYNKKSREKRRALKALKALKELYNDEVIRVKEEFAISEINEDEE
jgi:galactokinase